MHLPPTADAGGPYVVNEGSTVLLDGTGSTDPENDPLTTPGAADNLDDPTLAQPTFTGVDDSIDFITLNVYDLIEALGSSDVTFITVNNVPPTVTATGDTIDEGAPPGCGDVHRSGDAGHAHGDDQLGRRHGAAAGVPRHADRRRASTTSTATTACTR